MKGKMEMKEVKKFTCFTIEGEKAKGTIEGTKKQVLDWMKAQIYFWVVW